MPIRHGNPWWNYTWEDTMISKDDPLPSNYDMQIVHAPDDVMDLLSEILYQNRRILELNSELLELLTKYPMAVYTSKGEQSK